MSFPIFDVVRAYPLWATFSTLLCAVILKATFIAHRRNPDGLPLPPGPKGLPIIGNLLDMPLDKPWLIYHEWSKTYGDMVYFEVLGQSFLVLDTLERTKDLLDKRSTNYSDRMRLPMLLELMGWDYNMLLLPYGTWWRRHRRAFNNYFHPNIVSKYRPIQTREVRIFLYRLLKTPENFMHHIRHAFTATIMKIAYGINVKESGDPYISNAEEALNGLAEAGIPGTFLVDLIPVLKYVPDWFPGAGFKRKASRWRKVNAEVAQKPFRFVTEQVKLGTAIPSVATSLIEKLPDETDPRWAEEVRIASDTAAVAYAGGADTTVSAVQSFFLAMAMYPTVQKQAQAEIDAVVGFSRLPDFGDRSSLPFINALVKESMRWQTIIPLAFGHMASEDDEYNGYFIPKGTVVLGNAWAILHDPTVFPEPLEYKPERYLKDGQLNPKIRDPDCAAFGFGRRICPGRHLSDNSLYAIVSSILAVYDITQPLDADGRLVKLEAKVTNGILSYPVPFKCIIRPRGPRAEALIRDCNELEV